MLKKLNINDFLWNEVISSLAAHIGGQHYEPVISSQLNPSQNKKSRTVKKVLSYFVTALVQYQLSTNG